MPGWNDNDNAEIASWLKAVYCFLKKNRSFNHDLQKGFYVSVARGSDCAKERLMSLVWKISQTQWQANVDRLAWTLCKLETITKQCANNGSLNLDCWVRAIAICMKAHSAEPRFSQNAIRFFNTLNERQIKSAALSWRCITEILSAMPGFGPKTGRLLAKALYHCSSSDLSYLDRDQVFLNGAPELNDDDQIQLPVDKAIQELFMYAFRKKGINSPVGSPEAIGIRLTELCSDGAHGDVKGLCNGIKSEIWDDLWFWSFISQRGTVNRTHEFNKNKYLCLEFAKRDGDTIDTLASLSNRFIRIGS